MTRIITIIKKEAVVEDEVVGVVEDEGSVVVAVDAEAIVAVTGEEEEGDIIPTISDAGRDRHGMRYSNGTQVKLGATRVVQRHTAQDASPREEYF